MQGRYLGKTKLPFVIRIARFEADIPAFYIEVSMRLTKNDKEKGKDTLIFGCHSELDRDRWIAAISYLKIKSGYDEYTKDNVLINFLGRDEKDS